MWTISNPKNNWNSFKSEKKKCWMKTESWSEKKLKGWKKEGKWIFEISCVLRHLKYDFINTVSFRLMSSIKNLISMMTLSRHRALLLLVFLLHSLDSFKYVNQRLTYFDLFLNYISKQCLNVCVCIYISKKH